MITKNEPNLKLGICCVYYYKSEGDWVLELQLKEIIRNTKDVNFVIYAAANRLKEKYLNQLKNTPHVQIVTLPYLTIRDAEEHGQYLDQLIEYAFEKGGCSHVCTLDSDSWPIKQNWATDLIKIMSEQHVDVAAVSREELGDHWLPHPCGLMMTKPFFSNYKPTMWPTGQENNLNQFYQETQQRADTGIGVGLSLWQHQQPWLKFNRSNKINDHRLMAGIYGNVFFHIGASSRPKVFHQDNAWRSVYLFIKKLPYVWRYAQNIKQLLAMRLPSKVKHQNEAVYKNIKARLIADPTSYYCYLLETSDINSLSCTASTTAKAQ
ncbi:hypothetical protein HUU62_24740 [Rhodoferax sp. 4810]|uniref:Glycosyl transferase family 2 n=1 Tax=Thiospirillum jenense TaxID=1653858 RepID=A0A839HKB0_9GAMM|nr:hypothetical protein [Thiospirillum jenense]MBB1077617.1 hypothetical protein [Rhodoferax jenense]MBB1127296.1 hypothetical protein [Thiospirillum jenense]